MKTVPGWLKFGKWERLVSSYPLPHSLSPSRCRILRLKLHDNLRCHSWDSELVSDLRAFQLIISPARHLTVQMETLQDKSRFLNLILLTFSAREFSTVEDCPPHCRMFSSSPGLYPRDARSIPWAVTTRNVSSHCQIPLPWGMKLPLVENQLWTSKI